MFQLSTFFYTTQRKKALRASKQREKKDIVSQRRTQIFWHLMNGHMNIRRMKINGPLLLHCAKQRSIPFQTV